jgi:hypothetical protein
MRPFKTGKVVHVHFAFKVDYIIEYDRFCQRKMQHLNFHKSISMMLKMNLQFDTQNELMHLLEPLFNNSTINILHNDMNDKMSLMLNSFTITNNE